jgi:hypothetical protein
MASWVGEHGFAGLGIWSWIVGLGGCGGEF